MFGSEKINDKWSPILEHADLPEIGDKYRKAVTAVVLKTRKRHSLKSVVSLLSFLKLLQTQLALASTTGIQF